MERELQNIMEKLDDKTLDFLEGQIPDLMAAAITVAYNRALASGYSVLQVEGDDLVEQFPDGTKRVIEKLESAREVSEQ